MTSGDVKKVVLAYSGGLDTSVILKWLEETYRCEVVTFTADLGQGEELEPARAEGRDVRRIKEIYHRGSARGIRARLSSSRCSAPMHVYEGDLPARHVDRPPADRQAPDRDRPETGADAVSHGATGKGNDQVRFELGYYALEPDIKVIAPWREWDLTLADETSRLRRKAPDSRSPRTSAAKPRSRSTQTCCTSPPRAKCSRTPGSKPRNTSIPVRSRPKTPRTSRPISRSDFEQGDPVAIDGETPVPGHAGHPAERTGWRQWHRPARSRGKPVCRHEVPRRLRDPGRHHPAGCASGRWNPSLWIARPCISRTS